MKTEFLTELGIDKEIATKILAEAGRDIERERGKFADYDDLKAQLKKAQDTITGFGDVEAIMADVEKYKAEAEAAKAEAAGRIAKLEMTVKVKEFLSGKKFVNDMTREYIAEKMLAELDTDAAKGKGYEDIFKTLTDGKENIIADDTAPKPPVVPQLGGTPPDNMDDALRRGAGLPPLKK